MLDIGDLNYRWDALTIGAVAHVVLFVVGYAASLPFSDTRETSTVWSGRAARVSKRLAGIPPNSRVTEES